MRRSAPLSLEGFDPDVIEAAREVAHRAGVPLEAWIESVVSPEKILGRPMPGRRAGRPAAPAVTDAASNAADRAFEGGQARDPVRDPVPGHESEPAPRIASVPELEKAPAPVAPAAPSEPAAVPAEPVGASIAAMMRRLDALDRSLNEDRDAQREVLAATQDRNGTQVDRVAERLSEIERRMSDLSEKLSGPRPLGRRGRASPAEMRQAIEDVRRRQRELDGGAPAVEQGARRDTQQEAGRQADPEAAQAPSPAILELQAETNRLRESLGSLATGRDVGALEQAMRALAADVQRAQEPSALVEPLAEMRRQVAQLAEAVADNVHARMAGEVERLASRADISRAPTASHADRDVVDTVHRELDEIRHMIAGLAGPERIQSLAHALQAISSQIAGLRDEGAAPAVAALKPLLEEIRSGLASPKDSQALVGRIEALADRVDRVAVNPVRDLVGRLETLGETLANPKQRPAFPTGDLAPIQTLLAQLAEKVDRVESGHGSLDSLEKHVVALARRLDTRSPDPSLAGLERTMDELLSQIVALRDQGSVEAAVERATRKVVAETLAVDGRPAPAQVDALRADLDDLRARQAAADRRMQATMETLNATLSRLVDRMDVGQPSLDERLLGSTALEAAKPAVRQESRQEIRQESGQEPLPVSAPRSRIARRAERGAPAADTITFDDELLEPGAGRPAQPQPQTRGRSPAKLDPKSDPAAAPGGDVKTAFIAAARRAAQAAQADIAAEEQGQDSASMPQPSERRDPARTRAEVRAEGRVAGRADGRGLAAAAAPGLVGRLRQGVEKRRRPLLLGLAAVVLVLGAYQAFQMSFGQDGPHTAERAAVPFVAANPAKPAAGTGEAPAAQTADAPKASAPRPTDPQTTQALADAGARNLLAKDLLAKDPATKTAALSATLQPPAPSSAASAKPEEGAAQAAAPARAVFPQVAAMGTLGRDLASVPAALSGLKQAALNGEGAAVYELAAREADGRGMPRDLALAAKLYEKLAEAGYAPAQFKLGSFYEKGSGVVRDLAQAKSWYGRAADRGNIRAMHNLAVLHAENPTASGKPDFATASSWFRRAAEYGVRDSQYNLAVLYARGLGLGQDLVQSYAWFAAAASQGDEEAGKKRDDVATKLSPQDLAAAKSVAAGFRPKASEPNANDPPPAKPVAPAAMSLLGAPPPGSPSASGFTPTGPRTGV